MKSFYAAAALIGALALTACDSPEETAARNAEQPVTGELTAEQVAAQATTPQASMTPAEREELRANIVSMLDAAGTERAQGHSRAPGADDQVVTLQPLQSHNFTVQMSTGKPYLVFGACDADCKVVDLAIVSSSGEVIKTDTDSADFPVLDFTPNAAGTYTVRLTMKECSLAPCYAGARVYQKS